MKKTVSLDDESCFHLFIGERILKSEVFGTKTGIPAYSANVFTPFGYIKRSNITDFNKEYILWGIDADFNLNIIRKGTPFATTDHCGAIEIKNPQISPDYLLFQLRMKSHELGFDRTLRASIKNMRQVTIELPIKEDGEFDLEKQNEMAEKYVRIEEIKKGLRDEIETLETVRVEISEKGETKSVSLGDEKIFFVDRGARITIPDIVKTPGKIPVYSGSKTKDESMGFVSDEIKKIVPKAKKYNGKYITVNANGSVGKVFLRNEEFYLHDDVNIVQILDKNILYEYLLYELQNKIDSLGYGGWAKKLYKTELQEEVSVDIPIKKNGEFDLEKQKEIAEKYERIEETKKQILELIRPLIGASIEL